MTFSAGLGEFIALVGPNGAGKSTLLRILLGLLTPLAGEARLFGRDPRFLAERWRIGFVPQRAALTPALPATVEDLVAAGSLSRDGWCRWPGRRRRSAIDEAIDAVGLDDLRRRRVVELSGGQQQRVLIARALASGPDLLFLDEPVAGVDAESQRRFRDVLVNLVRDRGATVLLVSHELGAAGDDLDRVVVLKRKVLFDGPPADLVATGVSLGVHRDDLPLWLEGLQ